MENVENQNFVFFQILKIYKQLTLQQSAYFCYFGIILLGLQQLIEVRLDLIIDCGIKRSVSIIGLIPEFLKFEKIKKLMIYFKIQAYFVSGTTSLFCIKVEALVNELIILFRTDITPTSALSSKTPLFTLRLSWRVKTVT